MAEENRRGAGRSELLLGVRRKRDPALAGLLRRQAAEITPHDLLYVEPHQITQLVKGSCGSCCGMLKPNGARSNLDAPEPRSGRRQADAGRATLDLACPPSYAHGLCPMVVGTVCAVRRSERQASVRERCVDCEFI